MIGSKINKLPTILKVPEVAEILKIEIDIAYDMIYHKEIQVLRLGPKKIRVPKIELLKWIKKIEESK